MAMEQLERLEGRINKLIDEIERVTNENFKMQEQIKSFPYEEIEKLKSENESLKNEQRQLKVKIEKILELIDKVA